MASARDQLEFELAKMEAERDEIRRDCLATMQTFVIRLIALDEEIVSLEDDLRETPNGAESE